MTVGYQVASRPSPSLPRSPAIKGILDPLAGHVTTAKIDRLITEPAGGRTVHDVAQAFLKAEGLLR